MSQINRKWASVRIPKLGRVKYRSTRAILGQLKNVTIRATAGKWFISFMTEKAEENRVGAPFAVGVDRGVANTFSLSTGEHFQMPDLSKAIRARKRAQRALARARKGSQRRRNAKLRVARHSAHIAAKRTHWLHERSTEIARRYGVVTMEALRIPNMTAAGRGKRGLNRSILEQGWGEFARQLEYKLAERGGRVEYVNPAYTSQACSACGCIARENRKSQAAFLCIECGHSDHADTNAAINILRRSPPRVEGIGCDPGEAQTGRVLTHPENLAA